MNIDLIYNQLLQKVLIKGKLKKGRTAETFISIPSASITYNMANGFPLLTTKKIATMTMLTELEGFIHGITDKRWYQERGCNIWNDWANPTKAPYGQTEDAKAAMKAETDLGPIYGAQWRGFKHPGTSEAGVDQLANIIQTLKTNPGDRRMVCSAWNPLALHQMALPPCHLLWQVVCDTDDTLHMIWYQRSVDVPLGLPFDIGHYAMLLWLLAHECGKTPGTLTGHLADTHIYINQIPFVETQLARTPYSAPEMEVEDWAGIFNWKASDTIFYKYNHHPAIPYPLAV